MIQIDQLQYRYPGAQRDALAGLSLAIAEGSMFGLLGPNGSGKTTLISLLSGLIPAPTGHISVLGHRLPQQLAEVQGATSLVPQEYAFYPGLTVAQNLAFFAGVQGIPRRQQDSHIADALAATGLNEFTQQRAETFSGGLKRRLNIAIGLLNKPRLLFLDEPTVGIDPQSRHFILDAIKQINRAGTTVVYTSHYMDEVEFLCDTIAIIDGGKLLLHGSLAELMSQVPGGGLAVVVDKPLPAALALQLQQQSIRVEAEQLHCEQPEHIDLAQLLASLQQAGLEVMNIRLGHGSLEQLFMALTARQLRD